MCELRPCPVVIHVRAQPLLGVFQWPAADVLEAFEFKFRIPTGEAHTKTSATGPRLCSSAPMAAPVPVCPINETLLILSEKSRLERDSVVEARMGPEREGSDRQLGDLIKRASFRALHATTVPNITGGNVWVVEQLIVGLQVRGMWGLACFAHLAVISRCWCPPFQLLSFPLSASPVLSWGSTLLSGLSKGLSYLALSHLGGHGLEFAVFIVLFVASKLLVASYVSLGLRNEKDATFPHLLLQVRMLSSAARH